MYKTPKFLLVLTALFILFGMMSLIRPTTTFAATTVKDCKQWHTVKSGEYLSQIASFYGTDYRKIAEINGLANPNAIYPNQQLCVSLVSGSSPVLPPSSGSANIFASGVVEDKTVTLQGKGLGASTWYSVYLSNERSAASVPMYMGAIKTQRDGTFTGTYSIPKKLIDVPKIKVTIVSSLGVRTSNWFYNASLESNTGGVNTPAIGIVVDSSKVDDWVKIKASNLPQKLTFTVYIGKEGSKGLNGVKVGTISTSKGGSVVTSFDIPDQYEGKSKLDLRLENSAYGIVSYITFANKTK